MCATMFQTLVEIVFPFLFVSYSNEFGYLPKEPLVETKYGTVRGLVEYSKNLREYNSFRGIPYAKPPIGALRFQNPEPPEVWSFPIDARQDAPYCIQKNYLFSSHPTVEGSEDCLYLNIYIPQTYNPDLLPVMVFIHWGGFFAGRGSGDYMGPEYFMDRDVILVTFNYRLGVMGFLTTLDDEAPGNYGMKDQVMALKFVQENIGCFGGDKSRVTIFGQSAGSGSVSLHMASPASRGLFQQAISQSGTALDLWAKPLNILQPNVTAAQALFVGCGDKIGNNSELIKCLRNVDAVDLVDSADKFKTFSIEPITTYTLVIEKQTSRNPDPFLLKDTVEYFQAGEFQKVPWIVGLTQDEGILRAAQLVRQQETLAKLNANFSQILSQILVLQVSAGANTPTLYKNIVDYYLGGKEYVDTSDPKSVQGFVNLYTDRSFAYGIYQNVILQTLKGHKPVWMYNFNYRGQYTFGDLFAATQENINFEWGVSHCDDLLYLFKSPALFPDLQAENDLYMIDVMVNFWTNFAIYGDPVADQSVNWPILSFPSESDINVENIQFLNITGNYKQSIIDFEVQKGFHVDRIKFWLNQTLLENIPGLL